MSAMKTPQFEDNMCNKNSITYYFTEQIIKPYLIFEMVIE